MNGFEREIAIIVYPEPIKLLNNGLPVKRIFVMLSNDGDSMAFTGDNLGLHYISGYRDLEKYGTPSRVHAVSGFEEFNRLIKDV